MSKIIGIDPGTARRRADEAELAALRAAVRAPVPFPSASSCGAPVADDGER